MIKPLQNQRGLVSLIATMIISLFFVVISVSMVILMVGEERQASDAELSTRAIFAAEAGVEDAVQTIANLAAFGLFKDQQTCLTNPLYASGNGHPQYTCLVYSAQAADPLGFLLPDKSAQYDFVGLPHVPANGSGGPWPPAGGGTGQHSFKISWNDESASPPDVPVSPGSKGPGDALCSETGCGNVNFLPRGSDWKYPAAMEVVVAKYPNLGVGENALVRPSDIKVQTLLLVPSSDAGLSNPSLGTRYDGPIKAPCLEATGDPVNATGRFACNVAINDFDFKNNNYVVRLRPRYVSTHYKIELWDGNDGDMGDPRTRGLKLKFPSQTATIDVTAKAGDTYRRLIVQLPIRSGRYSGLDFALFSDKDICKDFTVSGTYTIGGPICPGKNPYPL